MAVVAAIHRFVYGWSHGMMEDCMFFGGDIAKKPSLCSALHTCVSAIAGLVQILLTLRTWSSLP